MRGGVILQSCQLRRNHANVLGALRHLQPGQLLDGERICPVIRQRADVVQPIGVRHRREIARSLGDLFVVAMQIAEHRLQLHHAFAIQHHIHAEHAMRRRMVRPQRNFEQIAFAAPIQ